jgi:hypothetical protein
MPDVGAIHNEAAYALGKMLDHSAWQRGTRVLPRGITGSDLDVVFGRQAQDEFREVSAVFDNNGRALLAEFSSSTTLWRFLSVGQKWVYETMLRGSPHVAVLCRHKVKAEDCRPICTRLDVISFQPMLCDFGAFVIGDLHHGNDRWQEFVLAWFADPTKVRRQLLGLSVGMGYRPAAVTPT